MRMRIILSTLLIVIGLHSVYGQGEIPVNMYTGTPQIYIPLWTVTDHDVSQPIGIYYNADGLRLVESKSLCGAGWTLVAGASIAREVRGLPDDYIGTGGDTRRGWLYNTIAEDIENFPSSADTLTSTCTDESAAYDSLTSINYTTDTEPDIFYYNAGGISGSFVFDNDLTIRLIPHQDVKIEYTMVNPPADKKITSFTVTTNDGMVYTFNSLVGVTRSTTKVTTTVEFLKKEFTYYDKSRFNVGVAFTTEWKLGQVVSPSGASLTYGYTVENYTSVDTVRVGIRMLADPSLRNQKIYYVEDQVSMRVPTAVSSPNGSSVSFDIDDDVLHRIEVKDFKRSLQGASSYVKEYNFTYHTFGKHSVITDRRFLKSLTESSGCAALPPYEFSYEGVDFENNICNLPSIDSNQQDIWGFFNGKATSPFPTLYVYPDEPRSEQFRLYPIPSYAGNEYILPGADRIPDVNAMQIGSLTSIKYPGGGSSTLNYEPNYYYDAVADTNYVGPGLRIKSITYFDGVNPENNMVKNYEYMDGSNSSGSLLSRPAYAIPTWEYRDPAPGASTTLSYTTLSNSPYTSQDLWEHLIVRSDRDIRESSDFGLVAYSNVKVSRPGMGSAEFEFEIPAQYGDFSDGVWSATINKFARPASCPAMGIVASGGAWGNAYSPNPNFDYERGFMKKKTEKNESGDTVRQVTYSPQLIYTEGASPHQIWGVSFDHYANSTSNIYFYGKYYLLTDVAKVLRVDSMVVFDANDQNRKMSTTKKFFYESANHKLLTRTTTTAADGTVVTSKMKYPLDFGTIPGNSDDHLLAIKNLQDDFRNGIPIEQTTSMQRSGQSEKVMGASLIKFSDFGETGKVLPFEALSLKISDGITDFEESGLELDGGTYKLTYDDRYQVNKTYLAFDEFEVPLSSVGNSRIVKSTHWAYHKSYPIAQAANTSAEEFVYSGFETNATDAKTGFEFDISAQIVGAGRTGNNALHPSVVMNKDVKKASVNNYILSFWLKKLSSSVDIKITIKDTTLTTTYYSDTITVNPTGSGFELVEELISVSGAPSWFNIEIRGLGFGGSYSSSPSLLPVIDDVTFYPEGADIVTYTYDIPRGATSITDATAKTIYTDYDGLGRELRVWDQDRNLIRKNTYRFADPVLTAVITADTLATDIDPFTFIADENCIDGVKYEWDFGEGAGFQESTRVVQHTFTTIDTLFIMLRKSHPYYGTATDTLKVYVTFKPLTGIICAKGAKIVECGGTTETYSCAEITATPASEKTIFRLLSIDVAETITSYSWEQMFVSSSWIEVSTSQETGQMSSPATYDMRCFITTNTGRTGYSNVMTVTKSYCE